MPLLGFYELVFASDPGWLLKIPDVQPLRHIAWRLQDGHRLSIPEGTVIPVVVSKPGIPLEFSLTAAGVPVVRSDVARAIEQMAPEAVQFIPASVDGCNDSYEILNVTALRDCIDEKTSSFSDYRGPGDFHAVNRLVIDPTRAQGSDIFRILNWSVSIVISESMRQMLARMNVRGIGLLPVWPAGAWVGSVSECSKHPPEQPDCE